MRCGWRRARGTPAAGSSGAWCASTSRRSRRSWSTPPTRVGPRWRPGRAWPARCSPAGGLPLGYHGDPDKTAATFVERDGERWLVTGDMATVGADGAIELLGRGSVSINTGGEKVHPEEVESALKAPPGRVRLPGRGRARRAVGQRGHRRRAAGRRDRPALDRAGRPLQGVARRPTRPRSTSSWSTPSCARRRARPTTAGPRRPPRSRCPLRAGRRAPATRRCGGPGTAPRWRAAASRAPCPAPSGWSPGWG